jgi:hypothetical protein
MSYLCHVITPTSILAMLTIHYQGQERTYQVRKEMSAYTLRYIVDIDGVQVTFEPDEEGHYRAFIPKDSPRHILPPQELVAAVSAALETL